MKIGQRVIVNSVHFNTVDMAGTVVGVIKGKAVRVAAARHAHKWWATRLKGWRYTRSIVHVEFDGIPAKETRWPYYQYECSKVKA